MEASCQDGFHNRSSSILARIPNNKAVALQNKILGKPVLRVRMFPPGSASGFVSHKYGSGSGSFHHKEKVVRKILISTGLKLLYNFLSF
jgi:hypothetical protein